VAKVLIFANDNSTLYNFRRELLARLVGEGFDVIVALPAHPRNQAFRDLGCSVVELPLSRFGTNPITELGTVFTFWTILRKQRPDVVLTYTVKPNVYGGLVAQLCHVPHIATVTGLGTVFQSPSLLRRISASLQKFAFRKSQRVFFQNLDNLKAFRDLGIVDKQSRVLPGSGVNLALHRAEPYPPDTGTTRFITVARIRQDKGYDELFTAIRAICAQRDGLEFHIVGWYEDDSYRDAVAQIQAECPVVFHSEVTQEEVHELIAGSHCLIHPSHHEGMANVILEAAAAGRPCIASDVPGCREAIDNAVTGFLHPVQDATGLVSSIEQFLALPGESKEQMGAAARQKMEQEFDRELVVDHYLHEIGSAANNL